MLAAWHLLAMLPLKQRGCTPPVSSGLLLISGVLFTQWLVFLVGSKKCMYKLIILIVNLLCFEYSVFWCDFSDGVDLPSGHHLSNVCSKCSCFLWFSPFLSLFFSFIFYQPSLLQPRLLIPDSTNKHMLFCGASYHIAVRSSSMHRHHLVEDDLAPTRPVEVGGHMVCWCQTGHLKSSHPWAILEKTVCCLVGFQTSRHSQCIIIICFLFPHLVLFVFRNLSSYLCFLYLVNGLGFGWVNGAENLLWRVGYFPSGFGNGQRYAPWDVIYQNTMRFFSHNSMIQSSMTRNLLLSFT